MIRHILVRIMIQIAFQNPGSSLQDHPIVRIHPTPTPSLSPKQPQLVLRIPSAMVNPLPQVKHPPAHKIPLTFPPPDRLQNALPKRLRYLLIRIEREHPIAPRNPQRHILLLDMSQPRMLKHPIRVLPRDLHGPILTKRIHHHNLIRPIHTSQTPLDIRFFVIRDDTRRHPTH